jgi:hypothetical protein
MHQILRARAAGDVVHATHLHNRMAKAWRNGSTIEIEILQDGLTDEHAFLKEIEIIASFPERQLWNKSPGGDKPPKAVKRSAEFRARVKASNIERWKDPELRARQSEQKKVHWLNPAYREKVHGPQRGSKSPSRSAKAKERWTNPDFRKKMDQILNDPSRKQQQSDAARRGWEVRRAKAK